MGPCGALVDFCNKNNIRGTVEYRSKKAKINSITQLFLLHVVFNTEVSITVDKKEDELKKFIEENL